MAIIHMNSGETLRYYGEDSFLKSLIDGAEEDNMRYVNIQVYSNKIEGNVANISINLNNVSFFEYDS